MNNQLLDGYENVKRSTTGGKSTPIVKITEGTYLKGILTNKKSKSEFVFNEKGEKVEKITLIATFKLIDTDAPIIVKGAQGYSPVSKDQIHAGAEVAIYGAPTRLRQALETIEADGTQEVCIVYEGKKKEKFANGKSGSAHNFKVGKKTLSNEIASEEVPD